MSFTTTHPLLTDGRGITSSEANHICNIAKEAVQSGDRLLSKMTTLERTLHTPTGSEVTLSVRNFDAEQMLFVVNLRAEYYPLVAVLREAIKARQELFVEIEAAQPKLTTELKLAQPPLMSTPPEEPKYAQPAELVSDTWGINQLTMKQFADMLAHDAKAAAYGAYLHNGGPLARLNTEMGQPRAQKTSEGLVTNKFPNNNEVEDCFMEVQGLHRSAEQRVNMYRSMVHDAINAENILIQEKNKLLAQQNADLNRDWQHERQRVVAANQKLDQDYVLDCQKKESELAAANDQIQAQFEVERKQARAKIAALKVVVPADLQAVFDRIKGTKQA